MATIKKHPLYNAYVTFISLLMFSVLIIYLPFTANNQFINFITLTNSQVVTDVLKHEAVIDTIIFYPIIVASTIAIFILNVLQLRQKLKFDPKKATTYLSLLAGLSIFTAQYSKFLYSPYILLFLYLFFENKLKEIYSKIKPKLQHPWIQKPKNLALKINGKIHWVYPHLALILIIILDNLFIFKANLTWKTIAVGRIPLYWGSCFLIYLIFLLLRAISRRFWGPAIITVIFNNFFYLFSVLMRKERNDTIVPSQLTMLKGATKLSGMVSPVILIALITCIILMFFLSRLMHELYPIKKAHWYTQVVSIILFCAVYSTTFFWNRPTTPIASFMTNKMLDNRQFYNQSYGAEINGPWVQFLNNIDIQVMEKPSGYSEATMNKVYHRYQKASQKLNQGRTNKISDFTVIYNLSESFADPKRVPTVSYKGDAIPTIHHLKDTNPSGVMMSSGFGGGTANMEYMTLTSMPTTNYQPTLATPYTQIVPYHKHTYSVADNFQHTTGIHPYNTIFYDRITDYPKLGLHTFYNIDDKNHPIKHQHLIENNPYLSDKTAYANTMDQLNRCHAPQFINLVTMQNHTPWDNKYENTEKWEATAGYGTDEGVLSQYIQGIHFTDKAIEDFVAKIDKMNRPIIWVFYGDHLPGLYANPMNLQGLQLHQTDYFIYLNPAAKAKLANQQSQKMPTKYVDPNEFTAQILQLTNSRVNPFQALQIKSMNQLPAKVMHTDTNQTNQYSGNLQWIDTTTGKVINNPHFNKQQKQLWHDYKLIQYDQSAGKHYLPSNFFK